MEGERGHYFSLKKEIRRGDDNVTFTANSVTSVYFILKGTACPDHGYGAIAIEVGANRDDMSRIWGYDWVKNEGWGSGLK
jgi:hypothetical protein